MALQSVQTELLTVDELKEKYLEPLKDIAKLFHMPRDHAILGLIAAFLMKLALKCQTRSGSGSLLVSLFFSKWQDLVITAKQVMGRLDLDDEHLRICKVLA